MARTDRHLHLPLLGEIGKELGPAVNTKSLRLQRMGIVVVKSAIEYAAQRLRHHVVRLSLLTILFTKELNRVIAQVFADRHNANL